MFGFSMGEMILIAAIALIAIGPKQLPEVARTLGKFMNELKRATSDFSRSFTEVADDTKNSWDQAKSSFTAAHKPYDSTVRAPPQGTVSNASNGGTGSGASNVSMQAAASEIDPNDMGSPKAGEPGAHEPGAHEAGGHGVAHDDNAHDPSQFSLFIAEEPPGAYTQEPVEEQLAFKLTSFDDEGENT